MGGGLEGASGGGLLGASGGGLLGASGGGGDWGLGGGWAGCVKPILGSRTGASAGAGKGAGNGAGTGKGAGAGVGPSEEKARAPETATRRSLCVGSGNSSSEQSPVHGEHRFRPAKSLRGV